VQHGQVFLIEDAVLLALAALELLVVHGALRCVLPVLLLQLQLVSGERGW